MKSICWRQSRRVVFAHDRWRLCGLEKTLALTPPAAQAIRCTRAFATRIWFARRFESCDRRPAGWPSHLAHQSAARLRG